MNTNEYQKRTLDTAIYPQAGTGAAIELYYLALGLTSESLGRLIYAQISQLWSFLDRLLQIV